MKRHFCLVIAICCTSFVSAQEFTRQDSLRGSITPERAWWDLTYYNLDIAVEPDKKFISGSTTVGYTVLSPHQVLQIDLQPPLVIDKVEQDGKPLKFISEGNAHFISLKKKQKKGAKEQLKVYYSGTPQEAKRAPWDGGFSWAKDSNGKHFLATSCQGLGASVWWPNKDHMYDEVERMDMSITCPSDLVGVGNGRLLNVEDNGTTKTYHWQVLNPINNYGVNVNIGDYVNFGETYEGENGPLDIQYYVLKENEEKAKSQFSQTSMMMRAFEHWFGPYPFYKDSFKIVEVPYLGMEHQSSITYGNNYTNGYMGRDLSGSGWGMLFDYIIIHEAGHEWFANNITYKDIADMWVHEGFTMYSEVLYLDYHFGTKAGNEYVQGVRSSIQNDRPLIGPYGLNKRGSSDMYRKGANMLHTLRQLLEDDEKFRSVLRGLNKEFYHQTVTSKEIEDYISLQTKIDLTAFFNQYLRSTMIPTLELQAGEDSVRYRYTDIVEDFDMPVRVFVDGEAHWLYPTSEFKTKKFPKGETLEFDPNFYINIDAVD
ncbi:MAG: M1 family metallopeptidase [Flavobacteriaceae bacterium]|nr:M1 family metallopeptidase [Flavobacteriaceae bacterium]MDH3795486.1 M1 family metallopeptidase [Flavobacteriaceae bacterium]